MLPALAKPFLEKGGRKLYRHINRLSRFITHLTMNEECGAEALSDNLPQIKPLGSLEELFAWQAGKDDLNVATIPLPTCDSHERNKPHTLVCHDMKGGYLQDRFVQGCHDDNCYFFYHWPLVDIFVYFSHHFVTIPPPGWTNAGHKHGTKILGTFITEWEDGKVRCEKFLESEHRYKEVADKLVELAVYYRFEGWLLNIENTIQTELIVNLVGFVKYLTMQIHKAVPGSLIIWYDSVTDQGELNWQNELNTRNLPFFEVSDGIFLNYTWKQDNLKNSAETGLSLGRLHDIYVGVDVFGRNCFGGGGFNTIEAVGAAREHGLSLALFAPGWVFEHHQGKDFLVSENRFWSLLRSHCTPDPVCQLPLATSFSLGAGPRLFSNGKEVSNQPELFLAGQGVQPVPSSHPWSQQVDPCHHMGISTVDAVEGMNSIKMVTKLKHKQLRKFRLFTTKVKPPKDLFVSYQLKASEFLDLILELKFSESSSAKHLCWEGIDIPMKLSEINENGEKETTLNLVKHSLSHEDYEFLRQNFDCDSGWNRRSYHVITHDEGMLESISVLVVRKESSLHEVQDTCLLGQIQLADYQDIVEVPLLTNLNVSVMIQEGAITQDMPAACENKQTVPEMAGSTENKTYQEEPQHQEISRFGCPTNVLTVAWSFPLGAADYFKIYCTPLSDKECTEDIPVSSYLYLGQTHANSFIVVEDSLPAACLSQPTVVFKVQPLLRTGFNIAWNKLPYVKYSSRQTKV